MTNETTIRLIGKTIQTAGLVAILTAIGLAAVSDSKKTPFEMKDVSYRGYRPDQANGVNLVYFGDREAGIVNKDRNFDVANRKTGEHYNVSGYTQLDTTYTTSNIPVKVEAE